MSLSYQQRVLRVLTYIHDNPAADLSLDALAEVALMSRFHWHRVFQAMTGETCAEAVRRIRLFLAANWLINGDQPIAQVAARAGYPNVNSFTRVFTQRFGVSPAAFRKTGQPGLPRQFKARGNFTMFKIDIQAAPRRRLAAIEHRGAYESVGDVFATLSSTASRENLWPRVRGMVMVSYDDPTVVDAAELRSHAGLLLADEQQLPATLEEVVLDGNECAVLHYKGPFDAIKVAYDYLYGDWLPKSGREPANAPPYEMYLNDPADTAPENLLTDIYLPLNG